MTVDDRPDIKQTNVSRPQLFHADSQHSVSVSEDYYSFSEYVSSESDAQSPSIGTRYRTPPTSYRSAQQSHDRLGSESTPPRVRSSRHSNGQGFRTTVAEATSSRAVRQSPALSEGPTRVLRSSRMASGLYAPTPGIDDTPYIRFAIDQLTRDQDARRMRHNRAESSLVEYPVDRVIYDEGLGYMQQERERRQVRINPAPIRSPSFVQQDLFVPFQPPKYSLTHPRLNFLPAILRPLSLGLFFILCSLMLAALTFCAVWSSRNNGLWDYSGFGDIRYFIFQYLPTILGMVILIWLFQIEAAVQRTSPFLAMASATDRSRAEGAFLDLHISQFILPTFQHFRAGQNVIGICFLTFWLSLFSIPLLAASFSVRFIGSPSDGTWRWVAVRAVIWTTVGVYGLLILAIILLAVFLWTRDSGLRWDPRSIADIIALLERSNVMNDYNGSETFETAREFRDCLAERADRLGYWHTSRRPQDVFYGIGEGGLEARGYAVQKGKIREKGPEREFTWPGLDLEKQQQTPYNTFWRDVRSSRVRFRFVPWFLRDSYIVAWIVIAFVLLLAFLIISFLNGAVERGFSSQLAVAPDAGGFSPTNFLYSFVPATIGLILYLLILPIDLAFRRLQPYASLSARGGATAEQSLLLDYPARLPVSVTVAAVMNKHYRVACLSLLPLLAAPIPILAGGVFWAQFEVPSRSVLVTAHLPGFYPLCVFLAIYAFALLLTFPGRGHRLPHDSRCLAHILSWLYMSRLLTDPEFHRVEGKADLVTRLVAGMAVARNFTSSESLVARRFGAGGSSNTIYHNSYGIGSSGGFGGGGSSKNRGWESLTRMPGSRERLARARAREMSDTLAAELRTEQPRYGFGILVGRDGLAHLGIDRIQRVGAKMTLFTTVTRR